MAVYVIGSMNIDMFFDVDHFVRPKETLMPVHSEVLPGGKGLNQACACARAGAKTRMAGKAGSDGQLLTDTLKAAGVDTSFVDIQSGGLSGRAIIQRDPDAENCILRVPGTNHDFKKADFERILRFVDKDDIVLIQNEISNLKDLAACLQEKDCFVVFNPAPVTKDIPDDLSFVSCLVANEVEIEQLLKTTGDPQTLCAQWQNRYPGSSIVLTLSSKGSLYMDGKRTLFMPAYRVEAKDTTGAGDTYTGYYCAMLDQGRSIEDALQYASAASALAVTRSGAASSIPDLEDVKHMIGENEKISPVAL